MKPLAPESPPAPAGAGGWELARWLDSVPGRYLLNWEQSRFDEAVADCFGYHALQLGLPQIDALRNNRIPRRWLAVPEPLVERVEPGYGSASAASGSGEHAAQRPLALVAHAAALPFAENALDLIALPHTLEFSADPHAVLREAHRVLLPEGRLVVCGLNPWSLWGGRQQRARLWARLGLGRSRWARPFLPEAGEFIGPRRLRDWLQLLGFEVESCQLGCYRPALQTEVWMQRWAWMERLGPRYWPFLGAAYCMVAVKRVRAMRLLGPAWKPRAVAAAPVAVAQQVGRRSGSDSRSASRTAQAAAQSHPNAHAHAHPAAPAASQTTSPSATATPAP